MNPISEISFVVNITELMKKLEEELKLRGYSPKTLKSYSFAVEKFLIYLEKKGKVPYNIINEDVKSYLP